jgi:hypothetical protein
MSGIFQTTVREERGLVAVPADIDATAIVIGCTSAGTGLSPFYLSGQAASSALGYGDAVDTLCQIIEQKQTNGIAKKVPAALYTVPATNPGTHDAIDVTGVAGAVAVTADSGVTPLGTYQARLLCVHSGIVGTAGVTLRWSLDDGRNYSPLTALGTDVSFTVPNSGIKFNFSPTSANLTTLNTLIGDIYTSLNAHEVLTSSVHGTSDSADNAVATVPTTNTAQRIAAVNACRVSYEAHRVKTAGGVHGAADTVNVCLVPSATDDATALLLALELKRAINLHIVVVGSSHVHGIADATNTVTASDPDASAFIAGDVVKLNTYAPTPISDDITAAFTAIAASTADPGLIVCEFPMTASLAAAVTSGLASLRAAGKLCVALGRTATPTGTTSDATWVASFASNSLTSYTDSSQHIRVTYGLLTDANTGRQYKRSDLAQFAADVVRVGISTMPDVPADQPLSSFTLVDSTGATVGHDEGVRGSATGLSNNDNGYRFGSNMRLADPQRREDVFTTVPWVMYAAGERVTTLPVRRIANALERAAVSAGNAILGGEVPYNAATNTLTDTGRAMIQTGIFKVLSTRFRDHIQNAGDAAIDTGLVQVNPNVTVTSGNMLGVSVRLAPKIFGYILNIDIVLAVQE